MWKVGCSCFNQSDLFSHQGLWVPQLSLRAAWEGPDLGWGLGPFYYREVGSSLSSPKWGSLSGGTEGSTQASPPPLVPVLTGIPGRAREDASRSIYSLRIWLFLRPLLWGGRSGGGSLWGSSSKRPWGAQLLPFLPLPTQGPWLQSWFKGGLARCLLPRGPLVPQEYHHAANTEDFPAG